MLARHVKLLSWLVNVVSLAFCVSAIWILVAYLYLNLRYYHSEILELPIAEILSLWTSLLLFKPLPESLRGPYQHLPNQEWIRLVKIYNASDGGLSFQLEKYLLRDAPPYRALSYTWGPAEGVAEDRDTIWFSIVVHGRERHFPKNLIRAVTQFRDLKLAGYFWIDAICIDQLDNEERSAQVNIMDKIYQRAEAVDVWLGRSYPDTEKVNDILREVLRLHEKYHGTKTYPNGPIWRTGSEVLPDVDWETLVQILSRRYFHRLWTLQEFALGPKINVWCGPHIIDLRLLQKSTQVLSEHQIPMTPSYGKSGVAGAVVSQRFLLQQVVQSAELPNFDFLACFQELSPNTRMEYETVLAWVFWQSVTTFATDPRDYVFGIIGIANAISDKRGLTYKPFKADYSLTAAQVFQNFVLRIMDGQLGVRAIALLQPSNENRTPGLPSWVPDLANRQRFGLSTNGGIRPSQSSKSCKSVHGQLHSTGSPFSVQGQEIYLQSHRIGVITKAAYEYPSGIDFSECANFVLQLIPLLSELPDHYPWTKQPPIDVLLGTMSLDDHNTASSIKTHNSTDFEKWLFNSLEAFLFSKALNGFLTDDIVDHLHSFSPWTISGLSEEFPSRAVLRRISKSNWIAWRVFKSTENQNLVSAQGAFCQEFSRQYHHIHGQRLFLLESEHGKLLGLGPTTLRTGDSVWATSGSEWPYIFRPREERKEQPDLAAGKNDFIHSFVGEAYVHGIMNGELFRHDAPKWHQIVLR